MSLKFVDKYTHEPCPTSGGVLCTIGYTDPDHLHVDERSVTSSQPSVPATSALIHPEPFGPDCAVASSVNQWAQGAAVAQFLDSLGITMASMRTTRLGRVECEIDRDDFDRARRVAVNEYAASVHHEPGGVFVEARIDGVPVQLWAGVA